MKRTKRWWSHLTKSERAELVWLEHNLKFVYDSERVARHYELVKKATSFEASALLEELRWLEPDGEAVT
jgi:hypothetical protein